jgi:hypothetical protein
VRRQSTSPLRGCSGEPLRALRRGDAEEPLVRAVVHGSLVTFAIDSPDDVLDCTYTNRARGQINILKTDDTGAVLAGVRFDRFEDDPPLGPPRGPEDTATGLFCVTSALGVCSIDNVVPGQYWVVEDVSTVPPGHTRPRTRTS